LQARPAAAHRLPACLAACAGFSVLTLGQGSKKQTAFMIGFPAKKTITALERRGDFAPRRSPFAKKSTMGVEAKKQKTKSNIHGASAKCALTRCCATSLCRKRPIHSNPNQNKGLSRVNICPELEGEATGVFSVFRFEQRRKFCREKRFFGLKVSPEYP